MELETPNGSPESQNTILSREIYITPEQISIAAIVDAIDARVSQKTNQEEEES